MKAPRSNVDNNIMADGCAVANGDGGWLPAGRTCLVPLKIGHGTYYLSVC